MNRHLTPAAATTAIIAAMLFAPVPVHADTPTACALDPRFLPHTADAAQAWFDSCRERRSLPHTADTPTACALDPRFLPHTADAAQAWFDSCRERRSLPHTADAA